MRVLFSTTRGAGHLQPLLPYARALGAHGHEVKIAGPIDIAETLSAEGIAHAPFGHPGDAALAPIWAQFRGATPDEALALAIREIFGGPELEGRPSQSHRDDRHLASRPRRA